MPTIGRDGLRPFLNRLLLTSELGPEEQQAILDLPSRIVDVPANTNIVSPGQQLDTSIMVADGTLARYDLMADGARQITAFHIAGDLCDLHAVVAPTSGWGIVALSRSMVLRIPHRELREVAGRYPAIALAFWRDTTMDASILAKWIANVGRRSAQARVAHLLCEMAIRSERAGLGTRHGYVLSATQEHIGDAMGLTPVHINRTLRALREMNLVSVRNHAVTISDWHGLTQVADFSPTFLLLDPVRRHPD